MSMVKWVGVVCFVVVAPVNIFRIDVTDITERPGTDAAATAFLAAQHIIIPRVLQGMIQGECDAGHVDVERDSVTA
jgi:hypothetical protein